MKLHLQEQPLQLLLKLLERPGEVVLRDEIRKRLWPNDTVVEFGPSINAAIQRLREALGDSAEQPIYIETVARRGYRFIGSPVSATGQLVSIESGLQVTSPSQRTRKFRWALGSVLGLGIVTASIEYRFGSSHTRDSGGHGLPLVAVPLTSYPGVETAPTFSPDGSQVAFIWNGEQQTNYDVYVKLIGVDVPLRLTNDHQPKLNPAWSPDGRLIAFLRLYKRERGDVIVIPALGGPERRIAQVTLNSHSAFGPFLSWSRDSKYLAVADRDASKDGLGSSLNLISVETGEKRQLTNPPAGWVGDACPAFSPDGRRIVFSRANGFGIADLYLLRLSEGLQPLGDVSPLTHEKERICTSAWTPDGRTVVFASEKGEHTLWRVFADGYPSKPSRLSFAGEQAETPAIARTLNGKWRLVFSRRVFDTNIWSAKIPRQSGQLNPTRLIASTRMEWDPEYAPDGKQIAFASDRSGSSELWLADADGSRAVQLTSLGGTGVGSPRWSSDGNRIAFDSSASGQWHIYVVNKSGGKPVRITDGPSNEHVPSWSRDGKWIYFSSDRSGGFQVWKVPVDAGLNSGTPIQVTRRGGFAAFESWDGKILYYSKQPSGIEIDVWRVPVDGGEEVLVLDSVYKRHFALAAAGLFFVRPSQIERRYELFFISNGGIRPQSVGLLPQEPYSSLAVSRDGSSILWTGVDQFGADLMLVEDFR